MQLYWYFKLTNYIGQCLNILLWHYDTAIGSYTGLHRKICSCTLLCQFLYEYPNILNNTCEVNCILILYSFTTWNVPVSNFTDGKKSCANQYLHKFVFIRAYYVPRYPVFVLCRVRFLELIWTAQLRLFWSLTTVFLTSSNRNKQKLKEHVPDNTYKCQGTCLSTALKLPEYYRLLFVIRDFQASGWVVLFLI